MHNGDDALWNAATLARLLEEDAVGQLRRRDGKMAELGSENGELKLDWVEGVARLLADNTLLEEVEQEARDLWQRGMRHLIWAGMGGSVITVRVLDELGFCSGDQGRRVAIYPLDSTDPAALNAIVRQIAQNKQLSLPPPDITSNAAFLRALLDDVLMVGVSMGMTSEEPITHLTWFVELLEQAGIIPAEHLLVMTLPGSYLDQFARQRQAPSRPLQLDRGTGTGGRMSAPTTRVFLLPAALYLTHENDTPGQLRAMLSQAWQYYDLDLATNTPDQHPFVQLSAALYAESIAGACRLLLKMPEGWKPLVAWIEQLMEESLGKGNKGIVVFDEQVIESQAPCFRTDDMLRVRVMTDTTVQDAASFTLSQPYLVRQEADERLAAVTASFLGWQLTMALYGYLHDITFAGQPAVENYKARARALRPLPDPLQAVQNWQTTVVGEHLTLLAPSSIKLRGTPASVFASVLQQHIQEEPERLGYLDFTFNGAVPDKVRQAVAARWHNIGNALLGVPVKVRIAPAAYHSTEQSEMDGPPYLVSLRVLFREHEKSLLGTYDDAFLRAQAVSTWQAMIEQGRTCFLLLIDGTAVQEAIERFLDEVSDNLSKHD
jgi:glucose-6-phosphate isomerase